MSDPDPARTATRRTVMEAVGAAVATAVAATATLPAAAAPSADD